MKQSRTISLIEAIANVAVGYGVAVATQIVVFPWFGLRASLDDTLAISVFFAIVSIVMSYCLRRTSNLGAFVVRARRATSIGRTLSPAHESPHF